MKSVGDIEMLFAAHSNNLYFVCNSNHIEAKILEIKAVFRFLLLGMVAKRKCKTKHSFVKFIR